MNTQLLTLSYSSGPVIEKHAKKNEGGLLSGWSNKLAKQQLEMISGSLEQMFCYVEQGFVLTIFSSECIIKWGCWRPRSTWVCRRGIWWRWTCQISQSCSQHEEAHCYCPRKSSEYNPSDCTICVTISSYTRTISFLFLQISWTTCHERMFIYFYFLPCITRMLHASDACLNTKTFLIRENIGST